MAAACVTDKIVEHSIFSFCPFKISPCRIKMCFGKLTHRQVHREKAEMSQKEEWMELQGTHHLPVAIASNNSLVLGHDVDEAREIISQDRPDLRIILEREGSSRDRGIKMDRVILHYDGDRRITRPPRVG